MSVETARAAKQEATEYSNAAKRAEQLVKTGTSEHAAVAQAVGDRAQKIALDADRRQIVEAGEHIAEMNRAIEAANKDPKTDKLVSEQRRVSNGGTQNLNQIKRTRDAHAHPEQNKASIDNPRYSDAENQQRLAEAAKKAAKEIPAKIEALQERLAVTAGPVLSKVQKGQVGIAIHELEAAQESLRPLAERGPTKATELTTQDVKRAAEFQAMQAGNHAKEALKKERLGSRDWAEMHDLAYNRDKIAHNELQGDKPKPVMSPPAASEQTQANAGEKTPPLTHEHTPPAKQSTTAQEIAGEIEAGAAIGGKKAGIIGGVATAVVVGGAALVTGATPTQAATQALESTIPGAEAYNLTRNGKVREAVISAAGDVGCIVTAIPGTALGMAGGTAVMGPGVGTAIGGTVGMIGGCKIGKDALEEIASSLMSFVSGGREAGNDPMKVSPSHSAQAQEAPSQQRQ